MNERVYSVRLKTHGVKNRRRFSESKLGTDFQNVCHAKTTPIFDSENRLLYRLRLKRVISLFHHNCVFHLYNIES